MEKTSNLPILYPQQIIQLDSDEIAVVIDRPSEHTVKVMPLYTQVTLEQIHAIEDKLQISLDHFIKKNSKQEIYIKFTELQNSYNSKILFNVLPEITSSYTIDKDSKLKSITIETQKISRIFNPFWELIQLIELNKLPDIYFELIKFLSLSFEECGVYGSKLIPNLHDADYFLSSKFSRDLDLMVYGDENSTRIMKVIKELINEPEHQCVIYSGPHHRLFKFNNNKVDILFTPTNKYSYGIKSVIALEEVNVIDVIADDSSSMYYPAVYKMASGIKLVSYNQGHKMQYSNGCRIEFKGYKARVVNNLDVEEEILLFEQFKDWVDLSEDKIYLKNGQQNFLTGDK